MSITDRNMGSSLIQRLKVNLLSLLFFLKYSMKTGITEATRVGWQGTSTSYTNAGNTLVIDKTLFQTGIISLLYFNCAR